MIDKNKVILGFTLFIAVLLTACGSTSTEPTPDNDAGLGVNDNNLGTQITPPPTQSVTLEPNIVMATVNGEEINSNRIIEIHENYFMELSEESIEEVLDYLINEKVLLQLIEGSGIQVSSEQTLEFILEQLEAEGMTLEDYQEMLTSMGLEFDEVFNEIQQSLLIEFYFEQHLQSLDINVSEEDVLAHFENIVTQFGENAPSLDEIRPLIEQELLQDKQEELFYQHLEDLRASATIVIQ